MTVALTPDVELASPWYLRATDPTVKATDELLERLEELEHVAAETIRRLRQREEAAFEPLLARMALDTMLHSHQLRRARERLAEGSELEAPSPPSATQGMPEGSTQDCLLALAKRGVSVYEATLDRMVAPAALRGMVTACLADERVHLRAVTELVETGRPPRSTPAAAQ